MANWRTDLFQQSGTGAVTRTMQDRGRDLVSVFDFMTDAQKADVRARTALVDVSAAINLAVDYLNSISGGVLWFPYGIYGIGASAVKFRSNISYIGANKFGSKLKALADCTDNVMGEASPAAAYSYVLVENLGIDGNRANVAYNNPGATDDAYQNIIRLNQVSASTFRGMFIHDAVMNGVSVYNTSNDNLFEDMRIVDIGKSTTITGGAASYSGVFVEFGANRNKLRNFYIGATKDHGILEVAQGADVFDNSYSDGLISAPAGEGVRIADDIGTNTHHRTTVRGITVIGATSVAFRLQPNTGGAINDATVEACKATTSSHGVIVGGGCNRVEVLGGHYNDNTNYGVLIASGAVDTRITGVGGTGNGTADYSDGGTTTTVSGNRFA